MRKQKKETCRRNFFFFFFSTCKKFEHTTDTHILLTLFFLFLFFFFLSHLFSFPRAALSLSLSSLSLSFSLSLSLLCSYSLSIVWDQSLTTEIIELIMSTHNNSFPSAMSGYATLLEEMLGTRVGTIPVPLSNNGKGIEYCVNEQNVSMTSSCVSVLQELKVRANFFVSFFFVLTPPAYHKK